MFYITLVVGAILALAALALAIGFAKLIFVS